jgi:hypothetical protein
MAAAVVCLKEVAVLTAQCESAVQVFKSAQRAVLDVNAGIFSAKDNSRVRDRYGVAGPVLTLQVA